MLWWRYGTMKDDDNKEKAYWTLQYLGTQPQRLRFVLCKPCAEEHAYARASEM